MFAPEMPPLDLEGPDGSSPFGPTVLSEGSTDGTPPADPSFDEAMPATGITAKQLEALHDGNLLVLKDAFARGVAMALIFGQDENGCDCVHHAAKRGDVAFLQALREAGVGAEWLLQRGPRLATSIHAAAACDQAGFLEALVMGLPDSERMTALCAREEGQWNPLHAAVYTKSSAAIAVLGRLMASEAGGILALMTPNDEGKTPADIAGEMQLRDQLHALAQAGVPMEQLRKARAALAWRRWADAAPRAVAPVVPDGPAGGTGSFGPAPWMTVRRPPVQARPRPATGSGPAL